MDRMAEGLRQLGRRVQDASASPIAHGALSGRNQHAMIRQPWTRAATRPDWGLTYMRVQLAGLCGLILCAVLAAPAAMAAPRDGMTSDIPKDFKPVPSADDYVRRKVMIPMRDGVKLNTIILIPNGAKNLPILMDRTPYNADRGTHRADSPHLKDVIASTFDVAVTRGYIFVVQDVRGKYGSEGNYVNERPLRGPLNKGDVDHATDTWDTIDWLVKNVKESNGRVGMIGTSYDGMMVLMALSDPHPALKAAVPINPVADTYMGDDDFHGGAFRLVGYDYYYSQDTARGSGEDLPRTTYDDYDIFLKASSASDFAKATGVDKLPVVQRLAQHPAYDAYWQAQALQTILAKRPLSVPTLYVASQWDQEDMFGAIATFEATRPTDPKGTRDRLVLGPWRHGGANGDGSSLGAITFAGDTGRHFRETVLQPFLDAHLKGDGDPVGIAPVTAYETGSNVWRSYDAWPQSCAAGCPARSRPLYLQPGGKLGFTQAAAAPAGDYAEYVSDPAKPVPYRLRPIRPTYAKDSTWGQWLVDDQRNLSDRPDVVTWTSEVLTEPVHIAGAPVAHLRASTSGTDSDWVVKVIDVYPDLVPQRPAMAGYQLMIAADIFRGRYRQGLDHPAAIPANTPQTYAFALPNANHVFLPGHRIMVQIQSSWFPLYDRNPQTYVENIFFAKPGDYHAATQRIFDAGPDASFIDLPVTAAP